MMMHHGGRPSTVRAFAILALYCTSSAQDCVECSLHGL